MNVAVVLDHRFYSTSDGRVWTDGPFAYSFFTRYLSQFDSVRVVARVKDVGEPGSGWVPADGDRVGFVGVGYYVGPYQYLKRAMLVATAIRKALRPEQAVILRVPSQLGLIAACILRREGRPFGAEVVGDPYDAYAPGASRHWLRPLFRTHHVRALRRICRQAAATAYVTADALQRRYPPNQESFTTSYSSVELPDEAFTESIRQREVHKLITVGSMEHLYKGQDTLLEALALCRRRFQLTLVGDGCYRESLERLAKRLGVADAVRFTGQLPSGQAIRGELDRADLFVLPSRQEGLPRAMLEAMARGLPCLGSTVGGIPELLPEDQMVPPEDPHALAAKLDAMTKGRNTTMAVRNLAVAHGYHASALRPRRDALYRYVGAAIPSNFTPPATKPWTEFHGPAHRANPATMDFRPWLCCRVGGARSKPIDTTPIPPAGGGRQPQVPWRNSP